MRTVYVWIRGDKVIGVVPTKITRMTWGLYRYLKRNFGDPVRGYEAEPKELEGKDLEGYKVYHYFSTLILLPISCLEKEVGGWK